jgi:hypothetical protein
MLFQIWSRKNTNGISLWDVETNNNLRFEKDIAWMSKGICKTQNIQSEVNTLQMSEHQMHLKMDVTYISIMGITTARKIRNHFQRIS